MLDTFAMFADPADRTNLLLGYADQFKEVPREVAARPFGRDHLVPHCESEAYVWALKQPDGTHEALLRGREPVGRVGQGAGGHPPPDRSPGSRPPRSPPITPDIVEQIFRQNISMGKGLGLMSMVQAVQALARAASQDNA